jgi:hypothetical protein
MYHHATVEVSAATMPDPTAMIRNALITAAAKNRAAPFSDLTIFISPVFRFNRPECSILSAGRSFRRPWIYR